MPLEGKLNLTIHQLIQYFRSDSGIPRENKVLKKPITMVNDCFCYILLCDEKDVKNESYKGDGYRFRQNGGPRRYTIGEIQWKKFYFQIKTGYGEKDVSSEFTKHVLFRVDQPHQVLILYHGDPSVAKDLPHGNARTKLKTGTCFLLTNRDVKEDLTKDLESGKIPVQAYNANLAKARKNGVSPTPPDYARDLKQVQNRAAKLKELLNPKQDDIYSLYEMGSNDTNFIRRMLLRPFFLTISYCEGKKCNRKLKFNKIMALFFAAFRYYARISRAFAGN